MIFTIVVAIAKDEYLKPEQIYPAQAEWQSKLSVFLPVSSKAACHGLAHEYSAQHQSDEQSLIGSGEVAEWSMAHAWKACRRASVSRVRIPLSPPAVNQLVSLNNIAFFAVDFLPTFQGFRRMLCSVAVGERRYGPATLSPIWQLSLWPYSQVPLAMKMLLVFAIVSTNISQFPMYYDGLMNEVYMPHGSGLL